MKIGSMFAGIGGAELALSQVFPDSHPVWQNDLVNHQVRARHWSDALQIVQDVRTVNPLDLPKIDLLTAGFPCQDLSTANPNKQKGGLDGKRSGLYREVLRFTQTIRPQFVLMENVSELLNVIGRLATDFREIGYGLTYTVCEAMDAGLPHHRRRVFVLAELNTYGRGLVDVDQSSRWSHPTHRPWPTPTVCGNDNRKGASPTSGDGLATTVRLSNNGSRLNPDWVEALMSYPIGWTNTVVASVSCKQFQSVRGRYPEDWDLSQPWPGFDWEPTRTIPDGIPAKGRVQRLEGLGNAWAPAQGALAIRALMGRPTQQSLFA